MVQPVQRDARLQVQLRPMELCPMRVHTVTPPKEEMQLRSYLDREILERLRLGHPHAEIAEVVGCDIAYVEQLASSDKA